jgi:O-antigen ligase
VAIRVRDARHIVIVVVCVALAGTAAAGGGYLPRTWGWTILGPAVVAAAALTVQREVRTTRAAAAFAILLGLLVAWTAVSLLWTDSVPRSVHELERDLVYVAAVGAVLALPRNRLGLTAGVVAATVGVCGAGLVTRLFPERYGLDVDSAYRLARPLGYWNAMGALAAIGTLLALGLASDARSRVVRALACAAPVVFVPTLVFSVSRGAAIALAAGLVVALALERERARFALVCAITALPAAAAGLLAARSRELTDAPPSLDAATRQGHRVAFALLLLVGLALLVPLVVDVVAPRLPRLPHLPPRAVGVIATVAVVGGALAAVAVGGKAYDAFRAPTPFGQTGLRAHLFSLSGHDRTTYWRVALDDYRDHPALGSGAGTYDLYWTRDRPFGTGARDAHSLYVETLAELGPLGLALLLAGLAAPFAAVRSARERPLVPVLAGAYAAYLVHAAADWDWEIPALTLTALVCGALLAVSDVRTVRVRGRPVLIGAAVALASVAVAIQRGNDAAADAATLLGHGRNSDALRAAERASRWAPWASEPWRVRADAERALGDARAARRSARRAIAKDPREWTAWFQLAYLTSGREQADADERVRVLNPLAPP